MASENIKLLGISLMKDVNTPPQKYPKNHSFVKLNTV